MASLDINTEIECFNKFYSESIQRLQAAEKYFRSLVESLVLNEISIQTVISRIKDREECISKFKRKYQEHLEDTKKEYEIKNYITDLIGIRVICLYSEDVKKIEDILSRELEVISTTDRISQIDSTEDQFGYRSLHIDMRLDQKRKDLVENRLYSELQFEIQIRSIIQDSWSVLDHKIKYKKTIPLELKRRINRLAAIFELADDEFHNIKLDTDRYEASIEDQTENSSRPLNIIGFMNIIEDVFPTYQFIPYKVDSFLHEILKMCNEITEPQMKSAIMVNIDTIRKYNAYLVSTSIYYNMNPYTMIRHCLYNSNKDDFSNMLYDTQKVNFNEWLELSRKGN
jgi:ppGpp synthetase/RelA/SpoT-type nucleotidyltranferase